MTLLGTSVLFFLAAAAGGAVLTHAHLRRIRPPGALAVVHPLLAASGILLLGAGYVRAGGTALLATALVVLAVAAAGGMTLAMLRVKRGHAPALLIGLHALLALGGVSLVLFELFAGRAQVPPPFRGPEGTAQGLAPDLESR